MARIKKQYNRVRLNIWVIDSQDRELRNVSKIIGKNLTDCVGEALQYWLAAQNQMLSSIKKNEG